MALVQLRRKDMKEPICPFCTKKYTYEQRIPKKLTCGDTLCEICLSGLVENNENCPVCDKSITGSLSRMSKIPTNFSLLEKIANSPSVLNPLEIKMKTLQNLIEIKNRRMKRNGKIIEELNDKLITCVKTLNRCKVLDDESELEKMIQEMEKQLWDMDFLSYSYLKPELKPDFSLSSFPTQEQFMFNIILNLHENKNVYAFKFEWYNKAISYAKLSFNKEKGILFIHRFTYHHPPPLSLLVSLNDLKECMNINEFRTFLVIEGDFFLCAMVTSSAMSLNFIRLCSGEDGISFKGLYAEIVNLPGFEDVIDIKVDMPKPQILDDYKFLNVLSKERKIDLEDRLIVRMSEGRCEIVKLPSPQSYESSLNSDEGYCDDLDNVVACAESSGLLFVYSYVKSMASIEDCGICFDIPIRRRMKYQRKLGDDSCQWKNY